MGIGFNAKDWDEMDKEEEVKVVEVKSAEIIVEEKEGEV